MCFGHSACNSNIKVSWHQFRCLQFVALARLSNKNKWQEQELCSTGKPLIPTWHLHRNMYPAFIFLYIHTHVLCVASVFGWLVVGDFSEGCLLLWDSHLHSETKCARAKIVCWGAISETLANSRYLLKQGSILKVNLQLSCRCLLQDVADDEKKYMGSK